MASSSNQTYETEIRSLSAYIECMHALKQNSKIQGADGRFFFRGQKNKSWEIRPSAFRNDLLSRESELIKDAYSRAPLEFSSLGPFEQLTKLQHYGLPTRLLDVTLNPLVALYFACEPYSRFQDILALASKEERIAFLKNLEENVEEDWKQIITEESDGCVFYKEAYDVKFDSPEINLICQLAERDLSSENTISQLSSIIGSLIYKYNESKKYTEEQHYNKLAKIFNSNYFVTSTFNNPRLIRQSGAFLLPACFYIQRDAENYEKSIINKQVASLNNEFESEIFIIPAECKQSILEELDMYNINKGTLFPELEHQMAYVRERRSFDVSGVDGFIINPILDKNIISEIKEEPTEVKQIEIPLDLTIGDSLKKIITDEKLNTQIQQLIQEQQKFIDWFKKDTIIGDLRLNIRKILTANGYTKSEASQLAEQIVNNLIDKNISD
nr:FRG domain-containing protein [Alistipes shahii]